MHAHQLAQHLPGHSSADKVAKWAKAKYGSRTPHPDVLPQSPIPLNPVSPFVKATHPTTLSASFRAPFLPSFPRGICWDQRGRIDDGLYSINDYRPLVKPWLTQTTTVHRIVRSHIPLILSWCFSYIYI
jgi:hypothetical protein